MRDNAIMALLLAAGRGNGLDIELSDPKPRNGIAPWREQPSYFPSPSPEQQAKLDKERAERERRVREASPAWRRAEARRLKKGATLTKGQQR